MPLSTRARGLRLLAALLVTTAACGDGNAVMVNGADVTGHWSLQSYNGSALPATAVDGGPALRVEVMNGSLDLGSDGTYTLVTAYRMTREGVATPTEERGVGYWVERGNQVTLHRGNLVPDAVVAYANGYLTMYAPGANGAPSLPIVYTR